MRSEHEKPPVGPFAALLGVVFFLGELFFGVRILAEVAFSAVQDPNYLTLLTRAILAGVFYSFGAMMLVYYQYNLTPATMFEAWCELEHAKPALPLWAAVLFSFIVGMHLAGALLALGVLSYRMIIAENISIEVYHLNAVVAIFFSALASYLAGLLRLPRWHFALVFLPAILLQMFFWILRDFFALSPMAMDSWVAGALMLFLVDGLVVMIFALPMVEKKQPAPPPKPARYSAGDYW